jgi:hypothetical protein
MSWNYRAVKKVDSYKNPYVEIHEVYYADDGTITSWSENACSPFGEDIEELVADISHYTTALTKPVLNEFDMPGWAKKETL